jgi:hypothetical protein
VTPNQQLTVVTGLADAMADAVQAIDALPPHGYAYARLAALSLLAELRRHESDLRQRVRREGRIPYDQLPAHLRRGFDVEAR